jgi:5,10-methylenetetrahydromethanopterin reductase
LSEISISCDGRDDASGFLAKVDAAEKGRAPCLWIANHLFQRDPVSQGALALSRTRNLRVTLMALTPFTMHPVQIAMAAATLEEHFPGRVALCLGVGAPADLAAVAIEAAKPLKPMREALELTRALLAGDRVTFAGESFQTRARGLASGARRVPLILAASGPQMLELAGSLADGVLISAGTSIEFIKRSLEHVERGAKGRRVSTHALVYAAVDAVAARAHDRLRRPLAILLRGAHHKANLELGGSILDQTAVNAAVLAEDWRRAEGLITDDIVRNHAASGTPDGVRARFEQYHAAGLDEIVTAGARDGIQVADILKAARPS